MQNMTNMSKYKAIKYIVKYSKWKRLYYVAHLITGVAHSFHHDFIDARQYAYDLNRKG